MRKLKLALIACGALGLAPRLVAAPAGGATFDDVLKLYDQGTKPALQSFAQPALWAGKMVTAKGSTMGSCMAVYPSTDPVAGTQIYAVHFADQNPDYCVNLSDADARSTYSQANKYIDDQKYTPLADASDPLSRELTYTMDSGAFDEALRDGQAADGTPLILNATWCHNPRGCALDPGSTEVYRSGDLMAVTYYWLKKL